MGQARRNIERQRSWAELGTVCGATGAGAPVNVTFLVDLQRSGERQRMMELLPGNAHVAFVQQRVDHLLAEGGAACRYLAVSAFQSGRSEVFGLVEAPLGQLQAMAASWLRDCAVRRQAWALVPLLAPELAGPLKQWCQSQAAAVQVHADAYRGPEVAVRTITHARLGTAALVRVPRALVEAGQFWPVLQVLDRMVADDASLRASLHRVFLQFDGYAGDGREAFEIPELAGYLHVLTQVARWWPVLAADEALLVWMSGVVPLTRLPSVDGAIRVAVPPGVTSEYVIQACATPVLEFLKASFHWPRDEAMRATSRFARACAAFMHTAPADAGVTPSPVAPGRAGG